MEGAVREPWEGEEGETSEDDDMLETEDDFAPDGETTGGKAQREGEFKMKIIEIEDADESDEDDGESEDDAIASVGSADKIVIEEVGDDDELVAASKPVPTIARVQIEEDD